MKKILLIGLIALSFGAKAQQLTDTWLTTFNSPDDTISSQINFSHVYTTNTIFTMDSIDGGYHVIGNTQPLDTVKPGDSISFCILIVGVTSSSANAGCVTSTIDSVAYGKYNGLHNLDIWRSNSSGGWRDIIDTFSWAYINTSPIKWSCKQLPNERVTKITIKIPDTLKLDTSDLSKNYVTISWGCSPILEKGSWQFYVWPPEKDTIHDTVSGLPVLSGNNFTNVLVYPNPNNGKFSINIQNIKDKAIIDIYSILGEKIYSHSLTLGISQISLSSEPKGLYMYRVVTNEGMLISSGKVIIQ